MFRRHGEDGRAPRDATGEVWQDRDDAESRGRLPVGQTDFVLVVVLLLALLIVHVWSDVR